MKRLSLLVLSLVVAACGLAPSPSSGPRPSAAALASLETPSDPNVCLTGLKEQVFAGTLALEDYDARALSECGVDFSAPPYTDSTPNEETTESAPPTAAELAYWACLTAAKAEVLAGTVSLADYEASLPTRCPPPVP